MARKRTLAKSSCKDGSSCRGDRKGSSREDRSCKRSRSGKDGSCKRSCGREDRRG